MAVNYQDVLDQLLSAGLIIDTLDTGRMVRCRVEGDRERRGWYSLHELVTRAGETILVGSFGVWNGNDNGARKIELKKIELSAEQRDSIKRRLAEDRRKSEQVRKGEAKRAADRATRTWSKCLPAGESDYLARKCIQAHGLRFSPSGALVIPMTDASGSIQGLQIIRNRKVATETEAPEKQFWPAGVVKKGNFHLIGLPTWIVLVAEGYATAASLFEATTLPVAVAFDAGNLAHVAAALRKRYKRARILICADDDAFAKCQHCKARLMLADNPQICPACEKEHRRQNTGVIAASLAAVEVGGSFVVPRFADDAARRALFIERGQKLSDFNDIHITESLHKVREQVSAQLTALRWSADSLQRALNPEQAGEGDALKPIESTDELMKRFSLVYAQGSTAFDHDEHRLISLADMRDACVNRYIHRAWMESPSRRIVRVEEVGFDPGGEDSKVKCNLWGGWPTKPVAGACEKLLSLLRYMCSGDKDPEKLYRWVLSWLAYPIQHPGAKMKTTLVIHGPQGTGKNLFFEAIMSIYGVYGRVIDQAAIEDRFNDWASRKLFLIADEVVARSDLYHIKNKLKAFITGQWMRINPKNMAAYDERNHVNMVFLSNEPMPVVLEQDDRRHAVIWTPQKLTADFYASVSDEIDQGGVAALHDYLLSLDLGKFNEATSPPYTDAKEELINQSLDSTTRFLYALQLGEVGSVKYAPALSTDFYACYKTWCSFVGERAAPQKRLVNVLARNHDIRTVKKRWTDQVETHPLNAMVMLTCDPPVGEPEHLWLGKCVSQFREAFKDFKGNAW